MVFFVEQTLPCLVAFLVVVVSFLIAKTIIVRSEVERDFKWQAIVGADTELAGGYSLVTRQKCVISIWSGKQQKIVVDGDVNRVAVKGDHVTGYARDCWWDKSVKVTPGYYMLNAATGERKQGMSALEWRNELDELSWRNPELKNLWFNY